MGMSIGPKYGSRFVSAKRAKSVWETCLVSVFAISFHTPSGAEIIVQ